MVDHEEDEGLARGTVLGSYTIVRQLGRGAFGAVYEARKRPLEKRIALKLLHANHARRADVRTRFLQEAQAAASLKHPHIVEVDDVGEIDGCPFIAMEYLEGESLASLLEREAPLSTERALDVLLPLLCAAAAVHERGIVHRDLKPDNVFLWKPVAGQVHPKLLDFGVAKFSEGAAAQLTQSGTPMGTPRYMSPEQWSGAKNATPQSDQWALAVILFECLAKQPPFDGDGWPALMTRISTQPPPPLRSLAPSVSAPLERVVLRGLEKDPAQRYESVREFGRALLAFASSGTRARWAAEFAGSSASFGSLDTLDAEPPTKRPPDTLSSSAKAIEVPAPRRGWRGVALGAGLFVFGLTVATAAALWRQSGDPAPVMPVAASRPELPRPIVRQPVAVAPLPTVEAAPPHAAPAAAPTVSTDPVDAGAGRGHRRPRQRRPRGEPPTSRRSPLI